MLTEGTIVHLRQAHKASGLPARMTGQVIRVLVEEQAYQVEFYALTQIPPIVTLTLQATEVEKASFHLLAP